jgi:hypothetical protein
MGKDSTTRLRVEQAELVGSAVGCIAGCALHIYLWFSDISWGKDAVMVTIILGVFSNSMIARMRRTR